MLCTLIFSCHDEPSILLRCLTLEMCVCFFSRVVSLRFSHRYRVGFSSRSRQASKNCQKFQNIQQAILATKLRPQIEKATVWRNSASKNHTKYLSSRANHHQSEIYGGAIFSGPKRRNTDSGRSEENQKCKKWE